METIKDMLENYNTYKADIKDKRYAILNVEKMTFDGATSNLTGLPGKTGYKDCSTMIFIENRDEKITKLKKEIELLEAKLDMLDGYINTLKPVARQIIELYYKDQLTEQQVADRLEMQVSGVQKSKTASIEKMQKLYDKNRKEEV